RANLTTDGPPFRGGRETAGLVVRLFNNTTEVGFDSTTSNGAYGITSSTLTNGTRPMSVKFEDLAGNQSTAGPVLNIVIDTVAPTVISKFMNYPATQELDYFFSESSVGTTQNTDLVLQNLTSSTTISSGTYSLTYASDAARFIFSGQPGGFLPDGSYRGTIAAGSVSDVAGNPLAADAVINF